jgi:hypothetical protein
MVQRGDRFRFALEAVAELAVCELYCDWPTEPGIKAAKDLAHAACAQPCFDAVRPELRTRREGGLSR